MPESSLVVANLVHASPLLTASDSLLHIAIGAPLTDVQLRPDAWITGSESRADLAALFARWLPPDHTTLDRLAAAFGRSEITALVSNLQNELRDALARLTSGARCDGHKLSGLTGTLGFTAASQAWRDLDDHHGAQDARRTSRAAIVSISHWLRRGSGAAPSGSLPESAA